MEWMRRGNGVVESAATMLEDNQSLAVTLLDATKSSSLDEKMKVKIISALIKNLHGRAVTEHDKIKEEN
jgi:hypothetical protein